METKKILKYAGIIFILCVGIYWAHEVAWVSRAYGKIEGYKGNVGDKDELPDYEDALWGNQKTLGNLSSVMGSSSDGMGCLQDDSSASTYGPVDFTEQELFKQKSEKIIYGKIERVQDVVCEAGKMLLPDLELDETMEERIKERANGIPARKKYKYNACLVKIRVIHNLYGDLEEEKTYWIMMGEDDLIERSADKNDKGLFVIFHNPTFVFLKDSLELVPIVGNITGLGISRLPYLLEKDWEGLDRLKTKEDVIAYWKKHKIFEYGESTGIHDITLDHQKIIRLDDKQIIEPDGFFGEMELEEGMANYLIASNAVFEGEIKEIAYDLYYGDARIRYTVQVNKSYTGKAKKGELVTVMQLGGYMPFWIFRRFYSEKIRYLEEKNPASDTLVEMDYFREGKSRMGYTKVSERAVFFVDDWGEEGDAVKQYHLTGEALSKLRYDETKNGFVERLDKNAPEKEKVYTEKEIENLIKEQKEMEQMYH